MRISFFLLFVCVFQMLAIENSEAQSATITLPASQLTVGDLIKEIERQTDYLVVFSNSEVDVNRSLDLKDGSVKIMDCLQEVFVNNDLNYEFENNYIVISKNNTPRLPKAGAAQQATIQVSGKVLDQNGETVIGANIVEKGTLNGAITDIDGRYNIQVAPNAILLISYIGYNTQEVAVNNRTIIDIRLVEDTKALDEVVVIGYGTQRKADLTGAVANVKADALNVQSNTNIVRALQGKIAGVEIVARGGEPGNSSTVMVRGVGTFNNNNPLYIVDGMYMDGLDFLNPNDIESIDVLKDASSAAIYGSRAANGVIIVTTKSGSNTSGTPTINASANLGFQSSTKKIDVLNAADWIRISTLSREAAGKPMLDMAAEPQADTDWQDEMMHTGLMQNYNISAQGGSSNFKYYIGGGYTNQDGIIKESGYERLNMQVKTEFKKGIVTVGENVIISYEQKQPFSHSVSRVGGIVGSMLNSIPTYSVRDENSDGGYNGPWGDAITWANPIGMLNLTRIENEYYKTYVNTYAILDLPFNLQYKLNVNTDLWGSHSFNFTPHYSMGLSQSNRNNQSESRGKTKNMLIENLLTFDKTFGDHKITALAGYTFQQRKYRGLSATGAYMPDGITVIDAATETSGGSSTNTTVITSYLGRLFYSYKNKYLLTATIRRDGSSKFMKENRFGNFPSVSAGWNMREEAFMQNIEWLDMLKVRGGYGVLGNQEVDNYLYSSDVTGNINYLINGSTLWNGSFPKVFASPSIKWENTEMTNIGVDVVLFNSRLRATAEYYIKNTTDILLNVPIPISTGSSNDPKKNAGHIRNKGFELLLGWDDHISKDWNYSLNLTASTVSNEVIKMGTGDQVIWSGKPNQSGANTTKSLQGYPIGGFWLIETDGLFQSEEEVNAHSKDGSLIQPNAKPGDIRFKDYNNDGKINDEDRVYKGSPFPSLTLGLNAMLRYKDFDLNIGIQGNFGAKVYNSMRTDLEDISKGSNYSTASLNHWTPENRNTSFPRLIWGDPNQNARTDSDRFLEKGDYVRITNVQLGYNIPKRIVPFLTNARVYLNADNLCTFTNYSGYTPDVNSSSALDRGVDRYTYPLPRTITLGVNVSF